MRTSHRSGRAVEAAERALAAHAARAAADPARPASHFHPPGGWMNDPNGTLWDGKHFHLFYQHNPLADTWGTIHWGHARSRDLVHWEHLPIALTPAREAGEDHCFSGGAWKDASGRPWLFYSSVRRKDGSFEAEQHLVECDASLSTFRPVRRHLIDRVAPGRPVFGRQWRDPFVFDIGERTFLTLAADIAAQDRRPVLPLYEAAGRNPFEWTYRGLLYEPPAHEHRYHECPNVVSVGDRQVLVFSPHGPVEYRTGRFDPDKGELHLEIGGRVDHGTHFYATNVYPLGCPDGPVLVGWVGGWTGSRGWNGVLGLPRVMDLDAAGHLLQRPLPGLRVLRRPRGFQARPGDLCGVLPISGVAGPAIEIELLLTPPRTGSWGLRLRGRSSGKTHLEIRLGRRDRIVEFGGVAFQHGLTSGRDRKLHLFWDRTVAELFLDGGRDVCSRVEEAVGGEAIGAELFVEEGKARVGLVAAWELDPIWPEGATDE